MTKPQDPKAALKRMTFFATALTLAGHLFLGFEQSWAQVFAALLTAYLLEGSLETLDARLNGRTPRYLGGGKKQFFEFFLSPHLTGLSVQLLLFTHDRLMPIVFATAVAIGFKWIIKMPGSGRHVFNPSNVGIAVTLLIFPFIGTVPPYHFTENVAGWGDWAVPIVISCVGTFLNYRFTGRVPLILAWLGGFVAQAAVRSLIFGTPLAAGLMPMTGMAFILYTFYMMTDPATTPSDRKGQILFGSGVAMIYGLLMTVHVVYGLFLALSIACAIRGCYAYVLVWRGRLARPAVAQTAEVGD